MIVLTLLALLLVPTGLPEPDPADTETGAGRLTRYLTQVMEVRPVDCPESLQVDPGARAYRCARFAGDFGDWKAAWEFNLSRHGLPETPASIARSVTAGCVPIARSQTRAGRTRGRRSPSSKTTRPPSH